jgi:hypothetical protein
MMNFAAMSRRRSRKTSQSNLALRMVKKAVRDSPEDKKRQRPMSVEQHLPISCQEVRGKARM